MTNLSLALDSKITEIDALLADLAASPVAMPESSGNSSPAPCAASVEDEMESHARAKALLAQGDQSGALTVLRSLAMGGTINWEIYNDLGALLHANGQFEEAIAALRNAANLEFSSCHALRNLLVVCVQMGDIAQLLATCHQLLKQCPDDPDLPLFLRDIVANADIRFDDWRWISPQLTEQLAELEQLRALNARRANYEVLEAKAKLFDFAKTSLPEIGHANQGIFAGPRFPPRFLPVEARSRPSILLLLPPATGSLAVSRILARVVGSEYTIHDFEYKTWAEGESRTDAWRIPEYLPEGHIYWWFDAANLSRSLEHHQLNADEFKILVVMRDPRDSVVSLYHLTRDQLHLDLANDFCSSERLESMHAECERLANVSVDDYAAEHISWWTSAVLTAQKVVDTAAPRNVAFLSYALLCQDFPSFLKQLISFVGVTPDHTLVDELLISEDVKKRDTLNPSSLSFAKRASPLPGRHQRELRPDTVALLNHATSDARRWMAAMEFPSLRPTYSD